jgi:hypothetical protein
MIQIFSQRDQRWANDMLGYNSGAGETIGNYGCLITCLAMACTYLDINETPPSLDAKLSACGGYEPNSGFYKSGKINEAVPALIETGKIRNDSMSDEIYRTVLEPVIREAVADPAKICIIQIDFTPATVAPDSHFVIVNSINSNGDITVLDPWVGRERPLADYYGPTVGKPADTILQVFNIEKSPQNSGGNTQNPQTQTDINMNILQDLLDAIIALKFDAETEKGLVNALRVNEQGHIDAQYLLNFSGKGVRDDLYTAQKFALNILLPEKDQLLAPYPDLHKRTSDNNYVDTINEVISLRQQSLNTQKALADQIKENNVYETQIAVLEKTVLQLKTGLGNFLDSQNQIKVASQKLDENIKKLGFQQILPFKNLIVDRLARLTSTRLISSGLVSSYISQIGVDNATKVLTIVFIWIAYILSEMVRKATEK